MTITGKTMTYENKALMKSVREHIKPHLSENEDLMWRSQWRWQDENGRLRNHYEMQSASYLCDTFEYHLVRDLHHIAIVNRSSTTDNTSDRNAVIEAVKNALIQHLQDGESLIWKNKKNQWRDKDGVLDCDHTQNATCLLNDSNHLVVHDFESVVVIHKNYYQ